MADYEAANKLVSEPAFSWWVPHCLKKLNHIISAVNYRIKKITHKYGVEIPTTVRESYYFDRNNGNNYWRKAIIK